MASEDEGAPPSVTTSEPISDANGHDRSNWARLRDALFELSRSDDTPSTWQERRLRLAVRRFGPLKDDILKEEVVPKTPNTSSVDGTEDEVDGLIKAGAKFSAEVGSARPTVYSLAKEMLLMLKKKKKKKKTGDRDEPERRSFDAVPLQPSDETIKPTDDAPDSKPRRFGVGRLGRLLQWRQDPQVVVQPHVKYQLDNLADHRPYFSYYVSFIQTVVLIIAVASYGFAPLGFGLWQDTGLVLTERLALEEVSVRMPYNFWVGPRAADLVHLGAKFTPCMRHDKQIYAEIEEQRDVEALTTGCCIRNDGSGCLQTTKDECSPLLSEFAKWNAAKPGPDQRLSGPVCGLDPRFCLRGGSDAWPDNISKWPACGKPIDTRLVSMPRHLTCEVLARPCCIGIHGKCELHSREFCDFVHGTFHSEASLCSQVSCMGDVCGMLSFVNADSPDQFYRLWTSLFLCAGIVHLIIVLVFQIYFMADLEKLLGWWRLATIYLISGIVGNMASAVFVPYRAETGPSGAIFGVLAIFVMEVYKAWDILRNPHMALAHQLLIIALFFIAGLVPWVDNYAHAFGFLTGLLLAHLMLPSVHVDAETDKEKRKRSCIKWLCYAILSAMIFVLLLVMYLDPFGEVEFFKWLSCIPIVAEFCAEQNIDFETKLGIF